MRSARPAVPPPRASRGDTLTIEKVPNPFGFEDQPIRRAIVEAVNRMGGIGEDAEARYQHALKALRNQSEDVLLEIAALYERLPAHRYLDRWSLVQLLTSLENPKALTFLDGILSSAIPPEESKNPATESTVGKEVIIRTTAIEAVERLAASGDGQALAALLKHTRHHNFSVKRAAIQAYLAQGGKRARQTLLKALPKKDHHILDIRRVDVRDVPQPKVEARSGRDPNELPPRPALGKREHHSR
jgi:hypothetical protein